MSNYTDARDAVWTGRVYKGRGVDGNSERVDPREGELEDNTGINLHKTHESDANTPWTLLACVSISVV